MNDDVATRLVEQNIFSGLCTFVCRGWSTFCHKTEAQIRQVRIYDMIRPKLFARGSLDHLSEEHGVHVDVDYDEWLGRVLLSLSRPLSPSDASMKLKYLPRTWRRSTLGCSERPALSTKF